MSRTVFLRCAAAVALVLAAPPGGSQAAPAGPPSRELRTPVTGGYLNLAAFVPTSATPTSDPDVYTVTFTGGSEWNGDLTGQTVVSGVATVHRRTGAIAGTFTDTLHGTYTPDRRTGTLTVSGTFSSDENGAFVATGRIVRGTCGFAGSRGSILFSGFATNGGYRGTWTRPAKPPAAGACAL